MTAAELLAQLRALGVSAKLRGPDTIRLSPSDVIPPALLDAVRAAKPELILLLADQWTWSDDPPVVLVTGPLTDPRPDLAEDSAAWSELLRLAQAVESEFAYLLHGMRACGTLLAYERGTFRMRPLIDPTERLSIWQTNAAWEADRSKWLVPYQTALIRLLGMLPAPEAASIQPQPAAQKET
jgi:hypothetical protein